MSDGGAIMWSPIKSRTAILFLELARNAEIWIACPVEYPHEFGSAFPRSPFSDYRSHVECSGLSEHEFVGLSSDLRGLREGEFVTVADIAHFFFAPFFLPRESHIPIHLPTH